MAKSDKNFEWSRGRKLRAYSALEAFGRFASSEYVQGYTALAPMATLKCADLAGDEEFSISYSTNHLYRPLRDFQRQMLAFVAGAQELDLSKVRKLEVSCDLYMPKEEMRRFGFPHLEFSHERAVVPACTFSIAPLNDQRSLYVVNLEQNIYGESIAQMFDALGEQINDNEIKEIKRSLREWQRQRLRPLGKDVFG